MSVDIRHPLRVYVAAPLAYKMRAAEVANGLSSAGFEVVSSWIPAALKEDGELRNFRARFTRQAQNEHDIMRADVLVALTAEGRPKATFAEIGFALALECPILWFQGAGGEGENLFDANMLVKVEFVTREDLTSTAEARKRFRDRVVGAVRFRAESYEETRKSRCLTTHFGKRRVTPPTHRAEPERMPDGSPASAPAAEPTSLPTDPKCDSCVTCDCPGTVKVDEDGLCVHCGGTPLEIAAQHGTPHTVAECPEGKDDPAPVLPKWLLGLTPEAVARINAIPATGPAPWDIAPGALAAAIKGPSVEENNTKSEPIEARQAWGWCNVYPEEHADAAKPAPREPSAPADGELARLLPEAEETTRYMLARYEPSSRMWRAGHALRLLLAERERASEMARTEHVRKMAIAHDLMERLAAMRARVAELEASRSASAAEVKGMDLGRFAYEAWAACATEQDASVRYLPWGDIGPDKRARWCRSAVSTYERAQAHMRGATPPPHTVAALLARVEAEAVPDRSTWRDYTRGLNKAADIIRATLTPSPLDAVVTEVCALPDDGGTIDDRVDEIAREVEMVDISEATDEGIAASRGFFKRCAAAGLRGMLACDAAKGGDK